MVPGEVKYPEIRPNSLGQVFYCSVGHCGLAESQFAEVFPLSLAEPVDSFFSDAIGSDVECFQVVVGLNDGLDCLPVDPGLV